MNAKRGKYEVSAQDVRWCIYPGCGFLAKRGFKGLEDHAMEQHGAFRRVQVKKDDADQPELFDAKPYLRN